MIGALRFLPIVATASVVDDGGAPESRHMRCVRKTIAPLCGSLVTVIFRLNYPIVYLWLNCSQHAAY